MRAAFVKYSLNAISLSQTCSWGWASAEQCVRVDNHIFPVSFDIQHCFEAFRQIIMGEKALFFCLLLVISLLLLLLLARAVRRTSLNNWYHISRMVLIFRLDAHRSTSSSSFSQWYQQVWIKTQKAANTELRSTPRGQQLAVRSRKGYVAMETWHFSRARYISQVSQNIVINFVNIV